MELDIELDRQVVQAGDEIKGWVTFDGDEAESVEVAFQGEEILGANDISHSFVLPVADEKFELEMGKGQSRQEFTLQVPVDAPPSYASQNVRCQYCVKATIRRGFWRRLGLVEGPPQPRPHPQQRTSQHRPLPLVARR